MRSLVIIAGLILCGAAFAHAAEGVADSTSAGADESQIYLSWGAGYGLPGASASLARTCGDTTRVDTLYLSFSPGRACSTAVGMTAAVWFKALGGDSLGPFWRPTGASSPPQGLKVEFSPEAASGHPFPWKTFGIGHPGYVKTVANAGVLRLIWAVSANEGARVVPGNRYALARILLRRPAAGAGCDQPVCVEWTAGTIATRPGDEPTISSGARFVGINAEGGEYSCSLPTVATPASPKPGKPRKK